MVTRTEAIRAFLLHKTLPDLAAMYNPDMECQVNVGQDGGDRVEGEFKGRQWHGWTDGATTWKSFRIPYKANSTPEYEDRAMSFDLAEHAEGIGMTGWDWKNGVSRWVAYDFDSIAKHQKGLSNSELDAIKEAVTTVDWVTIRKSTSGRGMHLYVTLPAVPTANHNEHAALARAILGVLVAITGYDLRAAVDVCGSNHWVWHRKMADTDGLTVIKPGTVMPKEIIPLNWKDHIPVISGKKQRTIPVGMENTSFEDMIGQSTIVPFDDEHKKLVNYLKDTDAFWWYDQDHHILITHTYWLKKAHTDLGLKGIFETISGATNIREQNCYLSSLRRGAWVVRRYTPGVMEHESWMQDGAGWTRCFLNREPDFATACRTYGGLEDPAGGFIFREAEIASKAASLLGAHVTYGSTQASRKAKLKQHKDGRIIVELEYDSLDRADEMNGWLVKKDKWIKIYSAASGIQEESEVGNYDDLVRHIVTSIGDDYGWLIKSDNEWRNEPLVHVKNALSALGYTPKDTTSIVGGAVFKAWVLVNKPFQPEYPGGREWNRSAAQLRFTPTVDKDDLKYPAWSSILNHCGCGLDEAVSQDPWCRVNGLRSGGDYLKCWVASLLQSPDQPLPYLAFYGNQNCGKSIFHEAISLLFTKGYRKANAALESSSGFNGELEGAILCVVEEVNLRNNKTAYNKIKDWVTSSEILIHAKNQTPYHVKNTSHWVMCVNDHSFVPVFPGDTRITLCNVPDLNPMDLVPKRKLIPILEKEAPDFLAALMNLEIPESRDRLNVPVLETYDKVAVEEQNRTMLETYINEECRRADGASIKFSELYESFMQWLPTDEVGHWSKIRVGRELPPTLPKGRSRKDAQFYVGNVTWRADGESYRSKYVIRNGFLDLMDGGEQ